MSAEGIFNAIVSGTPITIERPGLQSGAFDPVQACIDFDEGTMTEEQAVEFGRYLIASGLVNSTGTFQRFVRGLFEEGLLP